MRRASLTAALLLCLALAASAVAETLKVAVIAPSLSTSREARDVLRKKKWTEVAPREAQAVLVVVRSGLRNPLSNSYDSFKALNDDAEGQLNISGRNFHVYVFSFERDLSLTETDHVSYPAEDR